MPDHSFERRLEKYKSTLNLARNNPVANEAANASKIAAGIAARLVNDYRALVVGLNDLEKIPHADERAARGQALVQTALDQRRALQEAGIEVPSLKEVFGRPLPKWAKPPTANTPPTVEETDAPHGDETGSSSHAWSDDTEPPFRSWRDDPEPSPPSEPTEDREDEDDEEDEEQDQEQDQKSRQPPPRSAPPPRVRYRAVEVSIPSWERPLHDALLRRCGAILVDTQGVTFLLAPADDLEFARGMVQTFVDRTYRAFTSRYAAYSEPMREMFFRATAEGVELADWCFNPRKRHSEAMAAADDLRKRVREGKIKLSVRQPTPGGRQPNARRRAM